MKASATSWRSCQVCDDRSSFKNPAEFARHLRECHCSKEGGSFVCRYGGNGVCASLPLEGVSDRDYVDHVSRHHAVVEKGDADAGEGRAREWTVFDSTQNLPAVLNDPRKGKQREFFTKTWGEAFGERSEVAPGTYLPDVTWAHFEGYLRKTAKRYVRHVRRSLKSPCAVAERPAEKAAASDLDGIPKMFFQATFSVGHPETFDTLYPWLAAPVGDADARGSGRSAKLLQEKLTHYLDTIEEQIVKQISLRSEAFFHAMTSHDALMEQLASTVSAVKNLRGDVQQVDVALSRTSFKILKLERTRRNYAAVFRKMKLMAAVHQAQPTVHVLLSTSDFAGALDLIGTTQEILDQELQGVQSFRHLGSQLAELEKAIDKMMQADFVKYATDDLNRPLDEAVQRVVEEDRLVSILFGMLRQGQRNFVDTYRDEACVAIKALVKQTVAEAVSKAEATESDAHQGRLAEQMRLLGCDEWLELQRIVCINLLSLLRRIEAVLAIMGDAIDVAAGKACCPNSPDAGGKFSLPETPNMAITVDSELMGLIPEEDHSRLRSSIGNVLRCLCDQADERCAKMFTARSKDGFFEKISSVQFVELSKTIEEFVRSCEALCGRRSTQLQLCLQCQANGFVARFHEERRTKLNLILDSERWRQADVPADFQYLVDQVYITGTLSIPKRTTSEERRPQEFLVVDGEKFAVIGTVLMLLKMVVEYCQCASDVTCVSGDVLLRLVELLKMFNSRTCQLVLGAGALQVVGLKTITTRNLALASRCLQLVAIFVPKVRDHFDKLLPGKHLNRSKQLDQVHKDYNDHIEEIMKKLLIIIEYVFDTNLQKWEVRPPVPSPCFRDICKQLLKLHEATSEVLPASQVQQLFEKIHMLFKRRLKEKLQQQNVTNDGGPQHGLVTSELAFYIQSFQSVCALSVEVLQEDLWPTR